MNGPETVLAIVGRAGTGKTARLAHEAAALLHGGTPPEEIALFAATPQAAAHLTDRLRQILGDEAPLPRVSTLAAFELELLSTPEARALTGRRGRTLLAFEESMLLEDLKTSGVAPRRLSAMARFFYRSWADLEPMDDDWFYNDEERRVFQLLQRHLRYREAYHPTEVARAACDLIATAPASFEGRRIPTVFVDDYQLLSRASQRLAAWIARTTLVVAGDDAARVRALEEFPFPAGLEELVADQRTSVQRLDHFQGRRAVAQGLNLLAADEALGSPPALTCDRAEAGRFEAIAFDRPEQEREGVAHLVKGRLAGGVAAEDIAIIVPARAVMAPLMRTLEKHGVAAASVRRATVGGDIRSLDDSVLARAVTLLRLAADEDDPLALRSWCGFGDHLANSALFTALANQGDSLRLRHGLASSPSREGALLSQESQRAAAALAEAQTLLAGLADKRGGTLATAAWEAVAPRETTISATLAQAVAQAGDQADAAELCGALEALCRAPHRTGPGVAVGLPEDFAGCAFDTVIATSLVDGLVLPRRYFDPAQVERDKRPPLLAEAMAKTYFSAGRARAALIFTYFTEAPLAVAESLQLSIARVRLRQGERCCEVRPSETIRALTGVSYHD